MTIDSSPPLAPEPRGVLRRVWNGTALLVLGRIWGSACTFVALWLLAGHLEGGAFGRYTFYLAVFMLLDSLVDFGTGSTAVQQTADEPGAIPEVLAATRRIRGATGLLGVVLVGGGAFLTGEPGAPWILLASLYPLTHVLELSATVFRNRIAWGVPVALRAGASALSLCFVLLLLSQGVTEPGLYLCGVALGSASANVALFVAAKKHLSGVVPERVPLRQVLVAALPLGIAGLCQQAYFYVDNVFVRALRGEVALGHYNVGVRIMSLCIMVAVYAALVALPWFRREHVQGRLGGAIARLAQSLFAAAGLGTGLLLPWSGRVLAVFGKEFVAAETSLRWLFGAAALVYLGAALLTAVVAIGRSGAVLAVASAGLLFNLVGNAILVPRLGIDGAAIATFATEALVVVGAFVALWREGVRGFAGASAWRWAGGPVLFLAGMLLSSALAS